MISNLIIVYTLKEHGHKQLSSKEATLFFFLGGGEKGEIFYNLSRPDCMYHILFQK